jgi:hypothetical protein
MSFSLGIGWDAMGLTGMNIGAGEGGRTKRAKNRVIAGDGARSWTTGKPNASNDKR